MTSNGATGSDSELERFVRVDEIVTAAMERARAGGDVDIDRIAAEHPELESELRTALRAVASLERSVERSDHREVAAEMPVAIGPYDVVRELGRGGMGVVYEAEDSSLDRRVAVKLLPRRVSARAAFVERFRREAHAAARLEHPNVVPVYGVGEADGHHYFAMKYVDGYGLDGLVKLLGAPKGPGAPSDSSWSDESDGGRRRRFAHALAQGRLDRFAHAADESSEHDPAESGVEEPPALGRAYHRNIARIGLRVAEALGYAHARGVLHRDVKPANVLIDRRGHVWVADFGLAKVDESEDLTREGDFVGTLRYMAPEQFQGHAEPRSDVFGLGLVLYELLTLERALKSDSRAGLVHELLYEDPQSPDQVRPEVPQDLARIVMKAVAKLPEHRYRSAEAMAADLRAFLDGQPIAARAPSTLYLARLAINRNAGPFVAVALLFVALVVGAVLYVAQLRDSAHAEARLAYGARLAAAASALETDDSIAARTRLDACPAEFRGWEWRHLDASVDQSLRTVRQVGTPVQILSALEDRVFLGHRRGFTILDGEEVEVDVQLPGGDGSNPEIVGAWPLDDGWLSLHFRSGLWWSPPEGRPGGSTPRKGDADFASFRNLPELRFIDAAALTRDRKTLVVGERDGRIRVIDVETFEILRSEATGQSRVHRAIFNPTDTVCYLFSSDGKVVAWDVATLESRLLFDGDASVRSIAIDPTSGTIAVGSLDHTVHLLSPEGEPLGRLIGHEGPVTAVAFSPDGTRIATVGKELELKIWDASSRRLLQRFTGLSRLTQRIAFAPDGRRLFTANMAGVVQEWFVDVGGGRALITGHLADVVALGHSGAGDRFATGARDGTIRVHDAASLRLDLLVLGHQAELHGLLWHREDRSILSVDRSGYVMDWSVPGCRLRWQKRMRGVVGEPILLDGSRALVGSFGGDLWILNLEDGEILRQATFDGEGCRCFALSTDRKRLFVGTLAGHLLELDAESLEELRRVEGLHEDDITSLLVDEGRGLVVTAGMDGTLAFLDEAELGITRRLRTGGDGQSWHSDGLEDMALSPDGEVLVVGTHNWLVRLVDPDEGEITLDLTGHDDWVRRVAFSRDGESLVSTGSHSSVRVWDTRRTTSRARDVEQRRDLEDVARLRIEARLGGPLSDPEQALEQIAFLGEGGGGGHAALERAEHAVLHGYLATDMLRSLERASLLAETELEPRCGLQFVSGWAQRRGMSYGTHRLRMIARLALGDVRRSEANMQALTRMEPRRADADPVVLAARAWYEAERGNTARAAELEALARELEARDAIDRRTADQVLERLR